jgi:peroxiredoxin
MTVDHERHVLHLGDRCPAFSLPDEIGRTVSLDSLLDASFLTVIFLANHCPYVASWDDRIKAIGEEYAGHGSFVGIMSNDTSRYPQDGPEHMRERGYPFPYLYDEDGSVAKSFGATRTPEVFVFDAAHTLVYHGAVDSDWEESSATDQYLRTALDCLIHGQTILLNETPTLGCKIVTK